MVISDLKQNCEACRGSGRQAGRASALGIPQINYDGRCPACQGRGFALTELGQDLLKLLRPFISEMIAAEAATLRQPAPAKPAPPLLAPPETQARGGVASPGGPGSKRQTDPRSGGPGHSS